MSDTIRTSVLRMVAEAFPVLVYGHPRTYVVASVRDDKTLDLVPPPDAPHLQELAAVEQWSLGGALVTPAVGAEVCVMFRDANPSRPAVVGFAPGDVDAMDLAGGNVADLDGIGRVVRYGDPILFPPPGQGVVSAGAVLTNFSKVKA